MVQNCDFGTITITDLDGNDIERVLIGQHLRIVATPNEGYVFDRWWDGSRAAEREIIVDTNVCSFGLTVYFSSSQHTLSFYADPANYGRVNGLTAFNTTGYYNDTITVTAAAANTRYSFLEWDDGVSSPTRTEQFNRDYTFTARFIENEIPTYIISTASDPNGGTTSGGGTFEEGDSTVLTAIADGCHEFTQWTWTEDGSEHSSLSNPLNVDNIHSSRLYTAHFICNPPTNITFDRITDNFVYATWEYSGQCSSFIVTITDGTTTTQIMTTNSYYLFENLTPNTEYTVTVLVHCGRDDESTTISNVFTTLRSTSTVYAESAQPTRGTVSPASVTGMNGTFATFTASAISPNSFSCWKNENGDVISSSSSLTVEINGTATYYAHFTEPNRYTVYVTDSPGDAGSSYIDNAGTTSVSGIAGTSFTLYANPTDCYEFLYWTKTNGQVVSSSATYSTTIARNETYTANYQIKKPTVTVKETGCDSAVICWEYPECAKLFSYEIDLTNKESGRTRVITVTPSEDKPVGEPRIENDAIRGSEEIVADEETPSEPEGDKNIYCYEITGLEEGTVYTIKFFIFYKDMVSETVELEFETDVCSLVIVTQASPANGGTTTGDGIYTVGDSVRLIAYSNPPTSNGSMFAGWSTDGGFNTFTTANPYHFTAAASGTYTALFPKGLSELYNVTADNTNGGSYYIVEPDLDHFTVNNGEPFNIYAAANSGFTFSHWDYVSYNGAVTNSYLTASNTFTADDANFPSGTFTAHFVNGSQTRVNVTANVSPEGSGTTTGAGSYLTGSSVTLTATPNSNYEFVSWMNFSWHTVTTNSSYTFTVNTNNTYYTALFNEIINCTLTVNNSPVEGGTCSIQGYPGSSATVRQWTDLTVVASPDGCYDFLGWYDGATLVTSDTTYTISMYADINLVAKYKCKQVTAVTVDMDAKLDVDISWDAAVENCADFSIQIENMSVTPHTATTYPDAYHQITVDGNGRYHLSLPGPEHDQQGTGHIDYNTQYQISIIANCGSTSSTESDPVVRNLTTPARTWMVTTSTNSLYGAPAGQAFIGYDWPAGSTSKTVTEGNSVTLVAYGVPQQSDFSHWTWVTGATTNTSSSNPMTINNINTTYNFEASFESGKPTSITVYLTPNGGGNVYINNPGMTHWVDQQNSGPHTLVATTNSGWLFDNWTEGTNLVSYSPTFTTNMSNDGNEHSYTAHFSEDHSGQNYIQIQPSHSNGGQVYLDEKDDMSEEWVNDGEKVTLCAVPNEPCWRFMYFYEQSDPNTHIGEEHQGESGLIMVEVTPSGNSVYIAVFEYVCEGYKVNVDVDELCKEDGTVYVGNDPQETSATVLPGNSVWIHAEGADPSCKFIKWYNQADPTEEILDSFDYEYFPVGDITWVAVFSRE